MRRRDDQGGGGAAPAVVLGGGVTALSIARSLWQVGVAVTLLDRPDSPAQWSRAVREFVDVGTERPQERMLKWLEEARRGAVVLTGADEGVELLARHRATLADWGYHPVEADQEALTLVLDKLRTYELAREHGIRAPRVVRIADQRDLDAAVQQLDFPCVLKPAQSHVFARRTATGAKVVVVTSAEELREQWTRLSALGLEMFVTEVIYGESDEFVSYFGYLDEHGEPLVHFTKRKLRQCPPGFGIGTYHETTHDEEVGEFGLRFLKAAGMRGIGNVEFKRDFRSGELVLIECNPRCTLSNEVIRAAGIDLPLIAYNRALGRLVEPVGSYTVGVHLWDPLRDARAFAAYRRRGELSAAGWARSLMHRQALPAFRLDDPLPALMRARGMARHARTSRPPRHAAPSTRMSSSGGAGRRSGGAAGGFGDRALERLAASSGRRGPGLVARLDLVRASGVRPLVSRIRVERPLSGARDRLYGRIWTEAARELGAEVRTLAPGLLELTRGGLCTRLYHHLVPLDDAVTLQLARDKALVHRLMSQAGVPNAEYVEWRFEDPGPALAFLERVTGRCVVKPAVGSGGGHGVVPGVETAADLLRARWHAAADGDRLLIERQVDGSVYRLLILDGELLDVVCSVPASVTGDGRSTIAELIAAENDRRAAAGGMAGLSLIGLNLDTVLTLRRAGVALPSVLEEGRRLFLRAATSNNAAEDNATWKVEVAPSLLEQARSAVAAVGLRLAGVDVVTTNLARPLRETGGVINKVSGGPGLHRHYLVSDPVHATRVAVSVLEAALQSAAVYEPPAKRAARFG